MAEPILYHRAPAFVEVYARVPRAAAAGLPDREPGALLRRLGHRGDGVGGRQPDRSRRSAPSSPPAASSASAGPSSATPTAADTTHLEVEWGEKVEPDRLDACSRELERKPRAVFVTQSETSTGVVNDIRALNEVARAHGAVLCVDAISGLGAVDLRQDEWGVDVVVSGSQKSLMCPPGPRLRLGLRARDGARRRAARRPLLLRLGADREGPGAGAAELGVHPGGDPVHGPRRRARDDPRRGPRPRSSRATRSSPAPRGPGSRRSGSSASAPDDPTPTSSPSRACPTRSTAPRCRS